MATRSALASLRPLGPRPTLAHPLSRCFQTSTRRMEGPPVVTPVAPVRRPVGAFRGGIFGFLLGSTMAAYGTYYYILEEYRVSNELLTEDIYALQAAVTRIHTYVSSLEQKVAEMEKKK